MALPASLSVINLRGTYFANGGSAGVGYLQIYSEVYLQSPGDLAMVAPVNAYVALDSNGFFSIDLPATNDPQFTPVNYAYTIKEVLTDGVRAYRIYVPYDTPLVEDPIDGEMRRILDLATVSPIENVPEPQMYVLLSTANIPGGYAKVDADTGKISASILPAGAGGDGAFLGTWSGTTAYIVGDTVVRTGRVYGCIQDGTNQDPVTQTAYWTAFPLPTPTMIGLGNVNNTSDLGKPVSTATQAALDALALGAPVNNWTGTAYDDVPGAMIFIGPVQPTMPNGAIWLQTALETGDRARRSFVGFLGDEDSLTVLNFNDSFVGTPFEGHADWTGGALLVNSGTNLVIDGYLINAALFFSGGTNPTVQNCVVNCPDGQTYGLACTGLTGTLTVKDTTVRCLGTNVFGACGGSGRTVYQRVDASGAENVVVSTLIASGSFEAGTIFEQCDFHDIGFDDILDHADTLQFTIHPTDVTYLSVIDCYVGGGLGPGGIPISAGLTIGGGISDDQGLCHITLDNNLFEFGTYHIRLEFDTTSIVTNNNFGSVNSGEVNYANVSEAGSATVWTNNRTGVGAAGTGTTVPNPNP